MGKAMTLMAFSIPVQFSYNGRNHMTAMGPFNHSTEREFALTVNRRAIDDCEDIKALKPVAKNLLEGWSSMQTAMQSLMMENIQLRQALAKRDCDIQAAEELLKEAAGIVEQYGPQSRRAKRSLWPW